MSYLGSLEYSITKDQRLFFTLRSVRPVVPVRPVAGAVVRIVVSVVSVVFVVMSLLLMRGVQCLRMRMRQPAATRCEDALLHKICHGIPEVLDCKTAAIRARVVVAVRTPRFP
jgi:hypothetical protein